MLSKKFNKNITICGIVISFLGLVLTFVSVYASKDYVNAKVEGVDKTLQIVLDNQKQNHEETKEQIKSLKKDVREFFIRRK